MLPVATPALWQVNIHGAWFVQWLLDRNVTQPRSWEAIPWGSTNKLYMRNEREPIDAFFCLSLLRRQLSVLGREDQLGSSIVHTHISGLPSFPASRFFFLSHQLPGAARPSNLLASSTGPGYVSGEPGSRQILCNTNPRNALDQWVSKCGPQSSSICDIVRNANIWVPLIRTNKLETRDVTQQSD